MSPVSRIPGLRWARCAPLALFICAACAHPEPMVTADESAGSQAPPNPGEAPPNRCELVGRIVDRAVVTPDAELARLLPIDPETSLIALRVYIDSAAAVAGYHNQCVVGATIEIFTPEPAEGLAGESIRAVVELRGDTSATRWWLRQRRAVEEIGRAATSPGDR